MCRVRSSKLLIGQSAANLLPYLNENVKLHQNYGGKRPLAWPSALPREAHGVRAIDSRGSKFISDQNGSGTRNKYESKH
jgi:hypothetical protein